MAFATARSGIPSPLRSASSRWELARAGGVATQEGMRAAYNVAVIVVDVVDVRSP